MGIEGGGGEKVASCELWVVSCGQGVVACESWVVGCGQWVASCGLRVGGPSNLLHLPPASLPPTACLPSAYRLPPYLPSAYRLPPFRLPPAPPTFLPPTAYAVGLWVVSGEPDGALLSAYPLIFHRLFLCRLALSRPSEIQHDTATSSVFSLRLGRSSACGPVKKSLWTRVETEHCRLPFPAHRLPPCRLLPNLPPSTAYPPLAYLPSARIVVVGRGIGHGGHDGAGREPRTGEKLGGRR